MRVVIPVLCLILFSGCQSSRIISGEAVPRELKIEHFINQAEIAYKDAEYEQAEAAYQEVLKLESDNEQALYRLGNIAFRSGDFKKSANYFTRVVAVNPKNAKAHYNLGTIHLMYAEEHMKFFAATAPRDFDLSEVSSLLGYLDEFSGNKKPARTQQLPAKNDENLDKLVNLIESN